MLAYEENVKQFITHHQLISKGDKVAVGVSGGPDSLSLLSYLERKRKEFNIEVFALHLDHMFRGEESYRELQFVEQFCESKKIPFYAERINIAKELEEEGGGLQEVSRRVRYEFFERGLEKFSADKLALAHHGDDQIETVMMQLVKGSSSRTGIPVRRAFGKREIIRPLLSVNKDMIEEYCLHYRLNPQRDPSNEKPVYTRNRYRLELLPFLKEENRKVHEHFQRFSEELNEDNRFLEELTKEKMKNIWQKDDSMCSFEIESFQSMPLPLQKRGIHLILNYLYKGKKPFSYIHIQQILQLLKEDKSSWKLDLPHGLKVCREYQLCVFRFNASEKREYTFKLNCGDQVSWPYGGQFLLTDRAPEVTGEYEYMMLEEKVKLPLYIRTRKKGDKIQPKGMNGSKKLKDLFIDEKVVLARRDQWPIVTDSEGKLLWVPGLKRSRYEKAGSNGNHLILIYIRNHF
ncbi:tRNA lysidine(34) synthetase TilS [Pseudobacillus wudalianchiensis]|uniref:tRNA(Ile)-lysidine synthase n=1 Tax=Pseudobacillus wudalianchiensis TaxID=1743143 RepID=A0A1B9B647_9BACI|nr:tRNA lysidine(34) synthetase TilS [Bacillus wudalianchiensis]OCA91590.1 tRNA lysidine(34) synthetase TilS [Bacillus wudalianchiensis]